MRSKLILLPLVLLIGMDPGTWNVDAAKAKVEFSIKGLFGTVHGEFSGLKATIRFDPRNPGTGSISASIDAKTVSTGIGMRNHHLRTEEQYFNTDKYPTISFRSRKIEKTGNGYTVTGDLTIKDVTRAVQIPFGFETSGRTGVFKGQFVIKRLDYHLGAPGGSVGDEATIDLEVPVSQ